MQGFRQGEQFLEAFGYSTCYETIVTFYKSFYIGDNICSKVIYLRAVMDCTLYQEP